MRKRWWVIFGATIATAGGYLLYLRQKRKKEVEEIVEKTKPKKKK